MIKNLSMSLNFTSDKIEKLNIL